VTTDLTSRKGPSDRLADDRAAHHYAAIIESSDDAILSKDLNGVITSWNRGAQRLFGYTAGEAVGKSVTLLIPRDRHDEEPMILERIRRGDRIEHYDTVRQRKDGSLVDISLTVSPIIDSQGRIIGASKIARDISERKRAEERRELLLREMNHRVKNLLALAISIVNLSRRSAGSVKELGDSVTERLSALARSHALTLSYRPNDVLQMERPTTLHALIRAIMAPYEESIARFAVVGCDFEISGPAVSSLALLLHELATNSAKYGALSAPEGRIKIDCAHENDTVALTWVERGGPEVAAPRQDEGFGTVLMRSAVTGQLGGKLTQVWRPDGLVTKLSVPLASLAG
jgi:PAS domain S-box-containing protein